MNAWKPLILVVHDDLEVRAAVAGLMDGDRVQVAMCATGLEALRFVAQCRPSLVLSPWSLPDMRGLKLFEAVRRINAHTQVVLMDDGEYPTLHRQAMELGVSGFLRLPPEAPELTELVDRFGQGAAKAVVGR